MNPEREVRQVMSPTTRSGLGEGGLAEGVPTYGGVDSGGARGQLLHGGTPMNRAMAEGCGLTNGVGGQGVVDDQLPHVPEGRPSTTGSASREQGHGKGISHAKAAGMAAGAATMGLAVTADGSMNLPTGSGANVTTGSGANVTTGSGANADIGSGANARRFQGETLGLRTRSTTQQVGPPEQHDISTPPSQPTTSRQQPSDLQLPMQQAPEQQLPMQQGLARLPQGYPGLQPEPQPLSSAVPANPSAATLMPGSDRRDPQLTQRTALVTALQARAARVVAAGAGSEHDAMGAEEPGGTVEYEGDQTVWFTRFKGMIHRSLEPMFGMMRPAGSPNSWYSQSPTWSITTPVFQVPEHQPPAPSREQLRPLPAPAPEPRGDQSSTGSLQPEVVQEEVRRAVQQAMQQRDNRVNDLQQENLELKQLLMAMIDANAEPRGAQEGLGRAAGTLPGNGASSTVEPGRAVGLCLPEQGDPELHAGHPVLGPRAPPGLPVPDRRGAGEQPGGREGQVFSGSVGSTVPVIAAAEGGGQEDAAGKPQGVTGAGLAGPACEGDLKGPAQGDTSPSTPLGLLAQGIQQLQQLQLRKDGQDPELLKGSIELPKLPEPYQDTSAVAFLEWIYEAGQAVGSITDRASVWWNANLDLAMTAYHKFQTETPLKRLTIQAGEDPTGGQREVVPFGEAGYDAATGSDVFLHQGRDHDAEDPPGEGLLVQAVHDLCSWRCE